MACRQMHLEQGLRRTFLPGMSHSLRCRATARCICLISVFESIWGVVSGHHKYWCERGNVLEGLFGLMWPSRPDFVRFGSSGHYYLNLLEKPIRIHYSIIKKHGKLPRSGCLFIFGRGRENLGGDSWRSFEGLLAHIMGRGQSKDPKNHLASAAIPRTNAKNLRF